MKLLNLDKKEKIKLIEFFKNIIEDKIKKLQDIDIETDYGFLWESMDEIRNSILTLNFIKEFDVEKDIVMKNIEEESK